MLLARKLTDSSCLGEESEFDYDSEDGYPEELNADSDIDMEDLARVVAGGKKAKKSDSQLVETSRLDVIICR